MWDAIRIDFGDPLENGIQSCVLGLGEIGPFILGYNLISKALIHNFEITYI